ncbi:MAG: V-type ATP synthase subunit I [Halobacteria archaeon]
MLRPKRMSRVSVAGSKAVLEDAVEELHSLGLVHVNDYDGSWEGFENGSPLEGGEEVSGKLVQVRAVMNTLDVDEDDYEDAEGAGFETRDELYNRLDEVRSTVNEVEDEHDEVREELREAREERRALEPFADLGIDLELLDGYDEIDVRVGQGDADAVRAALEDAEGDEYEVFGGDGVVAVAARDVDIDDALVGVEFSALEVPDLIGDPDELLAEVKDRIESLEDELEELDARLEELADEHASFLVTAEEELSIEAEKSEAPLMFATTANSFYAEGWIPEDSYDEMESRLADAIGESVDVQKLETVEYDEGHPQEDSEEEDESPPVVQDNAAAAKPFEFLVNTVNRPRYDELDPTFIVLLTFPLAYGFMIGDMAYGILYAVMGGAIYKGVDSDGLRALGAIGVWAGAFTFVFGYLYGEFMGLHVGSTLAQFGLPAPPAMGVFDKGIHSTDTALTWLVVSVAFGILHLNVGYVFGFVNDLSHGIKEAVLEDASWILTLNGFFIWIFSAHGAGTKPPFLVGESSVLYSNPMFDLGFAGFPATVGLAGAGLAVVGFVMVAAGEGVVGAVETPTNAFGHVLSYLRIMAVLLAKGGMAFVVNLLVFGAYESHGETHFMLPGTEYATHLGGEGVVFPGLIWMGLEGSALALVLGLLGALLIFLLGHVVVLLLGITAAGIQMIRLEYVEFFGKFYQGGGDKFEPFGTKRDYTNEGK